MRVEHVRDLNHRFPVLGRVKNIALDLEDGRLRGEDLVGPEVGSLGQVVVTDLVDHA